MRGYLFYELRVKEQLGYCVSCGFDTSDDGFDISVYFPAFKFTTDHVDIRIKDFLKKFIITLKRMAENDDDDDDEFDDIKKCFVEMKKFNDVNLKEEVERNWFTINFARNPFFDQQLSW